MATIVVPAQPRPNNMANLARAFEMIGQTNRQRAAQQQQAEQQAQQQQQSDLINQLLGDIDAYPQQGDEGPRQPMQQQDVMSMILGNQGLDPQSKMAAMQMYQTAFPQQNQKPVNMQTVPGYEGYAFNPQTGQAMRMQGLPEQQTKSPEYESIAGMPGYVRKKGTTQAVRIENLPEVQQEAKPPKLQTYQQGREKVTGYYDHGGQWVEVARGGMDAQTTNDKVKYTDPTTGNVREVRRGSDNEAKLKKAGFIEGTFPSGMDIEVGPDGTIIRTGSPRGGGQGSEFTKSTKTELEKDILKSSAGLQRLNAVENSFDKNFLTFEGKFKGSWSDLKERAGFDLPEDEKMFANKYFKFQQAAINNLNQYIHDMTGAAMSEPEAKRITKGVPNAGTGIFDGDGPTKFKAKFDSTKKELRLVQARAYYTLNNGFRFPGKTKEERAEAMSRAIPLDSMPKIINDRANEIGAQIKAQNPGMPKEQIRAMISSQISKEFGFVE